MNIDIFVDICSYGCSYSYRHVSHNMKIAVLKNHILIYKFISSGKSCIYEKFIEHISHNGEFAIYNSIFNKVVMNYNKSIFTENTLEICIRNAYKYNHIDYIHNLFEKIHLTEKLYKICYTLACFSDKICIVKKLDKQFNIKITSYNVILYEICIRGCYNVFVYLLENNLITFDDLFKTDEYEYLTTHIMLIFGHAHEKMIIYLCEKYNVLENIKVLDLLERTNSHDILLNVNLIKLFTKYNLINCEKIKHSFSYALLNNAHDSLKYLYDNKYLDSEFIKMYMNIHYDLIDDNNTNIIYNIIM